VEKVEAKVSLGKGSCRAAQSCRHGGSNSVIKVHWNERGFVKIDKEARGKGEIVKDVLGGTH